MSENQRIPAALAQLDPALALELMAHSNSAHFMANQQILREGQYVKAVPIVLEGLVRVYTRFQDRELLLYYIRPSESCVMSFAAGLSNEASRVYAVTEEESDILLLPATRLPGWIREFPGINQLFFDQYKDRYADLLDTVNHLLFHRLDKRLMDYLREKSLLTGENPLNISHRRIASELGTAREVVSRLVKKLEKDGLLQQYPNSTLIEIREVS